MYQTVTQAELRFDPWPGFYSGGNRNWPSSVEAMRAKVLDNAYLSLKELQEQGQDCEIADTPKKRREEKNYRRLQKIEFDNWVDGLAKVETWGENDR